MRIGGLIQNMKVGESGYTLPWALDAVQGKGRLWWWLRGDYPVANAEEGTMRMRIERQKDGFHVWPPKDETYFPSSDRSALYSLCATVHDGKTTSKPIQPKVAKPAQLRTATTKLLKAVKAKPKSKPVSKRLSEDLDIVQRRNLELKK